MAIDDRTRAMAHLNDVPLQVEVELDRNVATIQEVLRLSVGHVFSLNKAAGEPVEILVGGAYFGIGEIISLNDSTGVRISELSTEIDHRYHDTGEVGLAVIPSRHDVGGA